MNPLSALLRRRRAATRNRRFVTESYQRLIGEKPDGATTTFYLSMLQEGGGRNDVLLSMVRSEKYVERVAGPIAGEPYADDEAFHTAHGGSLSSRVPASSVSRGWSNHCTSATTTTCG